MASNLAKAAAVGALAMQNGGGGGEGGVGIGIENDNNNQIPAAAAASSSSSVENKKILPACPNTAIPHYHEPDACRTKPSRPMKGHIERESIYERLKNSGTGATLVPNQKTVVCPIVVQSLENPTTAQKGFDTTWIVENTSSVEVVISWVVNGIEWSPFEPNVKSIDDPKARLQPGDWQSIPTFESFVYTVREVLAGGFPGDVVLQHRAGLVPLGNPNDNEKFQCDTTNPDVEPVNPETAERERGFKRTPTHENRPCNTIDIGFRNQVGCPLDVYWGRLGTSPPTEGFNCDEKFKFHLGIKPATQDFMFDWESQTKFEGSYIGHTFVARLADNPDIVVDSYTLQPTKIIDCPKVKKQKVAVSSQSQEEAEVAIGAEGTIQPLGDEQLVVDSDATTFVEAAATGGLAS